MRPQVWTLMILVVGLSLGCSRSKTDTGSLVIGLPQQAKVSGKSLSSKASTLSDNEEIGYAAFNIRLPGSSTPQVYEFDFDRDDSSSAAGAGPTQVVLDNVPVGEVFVQFLGVYEDGVEGLTIFRYADAKVNVQGETAVTLKAEKAGTSTTEYRALGRIWNSASGGPTGALVLNIHPTSGAPPMKVKGFNIFNGWTELFHPGGGIRISYTDAVTGAVVIPEHDETHPIFAANGSGDKSILFNIPARYSWRDGGEKRPEAKVSIGHFLTNGVAKSFGSTNLCVLDKVEKIPGIFLDPSFLTPLKYQQDGSGTSMHLGVGGDSSSSIYTIYYDDTICFDDTNESLRVYHAEAEYGEADLIGMKGPFRRVVEGSGHFNDFLGAHLYDDGGSLKYRLYWDYMPDAAQVLGAIRIYGKYTTSHDGGGDDREACTMAIANGFSELGVSTTPSTVKQYLYSTGIPGAPALSENNYYNFKFLVCPEWPDGEPVAEVSLETYCSGSCLDHNTGRGYPGSADHTVTASEDIFSPSGDLQGFSTRVEAVSYDSSAKLLDVTVPVSGYRGVLQTGDDVLFQVVSQDGSGCAASPFPSGVQVGQHSVARVVSYTSGQILVARTDGLLSRLVTLTNLNAAPDVGISHCFVTVTKIQEFGVLTVNGGMNFTAGNLNMATPLEGGGALAIRAAKIILNDNSKITASAQGYAGGTNTTYHGAGRQGLSGASISFGGGQGDTAGSGDQSGAGGAGAGENGEDAPNSFAGGFSTGGGGGGGDLITQLGGGGGRAWESGGGSDGGEGGGLVYIVAEEIDHVGSSNPAYITSSGAAGVASGPESSGGGGGGSVNVFARRIGNSGGSQTIDIEALGGLSSGNGGDGGNGKISLHYCSGDVSEFNVDAGSPGNENVRTDTDTYFCEDN